MSDPRSHVPALSTRVESTDVGTAGACAELDAFAREHGIADAARERLSRATAEVLARLVAIGTDSEVTLLEADIDQGTIQILCTRDLGSRHSVEEARMRLADTAASCDDIAIHRVGDGSTIEVLMCFALA